VVINGNKNIVKSSALFFIIFFFSYFIFQGMITSPNEIDSLKLHIPTAHKILDGSIYNPKTFTNDLFYYPWIIEYILAVFILLKIPLNLYNVVATGFLLLAIFKLTNLVIKEKQNALFAISFCFLPVITRWLNTQKNDIWTVFFYIISICILEKGLSSRKSYLLLGVTLGAVAGAKYFSWLFIIPVIAIYYKQFTNSKKISFLILTFLSLSLIGGSWILRAWFYTGNPVYPLNIAIVSGSGDEFFRFNLIKYILFFKNGLFIFIEKLFSEYLFWALALFSIPFFTLHIKHKNKSLSDSIKRIASLGFINFVIFLFLPTWVDNLTSSMRYGYYSIIPLAIVSWWLLIKHKTQFWAYTLSFLTIFTGLTNFDFRPKIALFSLIVLFVVIKYKKEQKFNFHDS